MKVTAVVTRSGKWWAIDVPEVPGVHSQAHRLTGVEAMTIDAVSFALEIDPAEVSVRIEASEAQRLASAQLKMRNAEHALSEASGQFAEEVVSLKQEGLTVREIALLAGISPQRVQQIVQKRRSLAA